MFWGQQVCKDTDNGATDVDGDRCSDYDDSFCGDDAYDDVDFTLADMCCVCGGGEMVDAKEQKPHSKKWSDLISKLKPRNQ